MASQDVKLYKPYMVHFYQFCSLWPRPLNGNVVQSVIKVSCFNENHNVIIFIVNEFRVPTVTNMHMYQPKCFAVISILSRSVLIFIYVVK